MVVFPLCSATLRRRRTTALAAPPPCMQALSQSPLKSAGSMGECSEMDHTGLNRRDVLTGAAGFAMAVGLPALAQAQAAPKEAPEVAALVAQNRLPPLEQRVGSAPLVVTPNEPNGRYGGTLRRGLRG